MAKKPSIAGEALGLFTDIVNGVRAALKKAGGNDSNRDRLRDPRFFEIAAAYATGEVITIGAAVQASGQAALEFFDRTITVTINFSKSFTQLIADGKYNWVDDNVARLFKLATLNEGTRSSEIILLHYNKTMTSAEVLADMKRQGLPAATFLELLWIGIQHPLVQLDFPIIALGSVVGLDGDRHVAYLNRSDGRRDLYLSWFGDGWSGGCRFAAVRK